MTTTIAPQRTPDLPDREALPALDQDPGGEQAGAWSFDLTQGRKIGSDPYDDPTQGRRVGSDPYDDPTRPRR